MLRCKQNKVNILIPRVFFLLTGQDDTDAKLARRTSYLLATRQRVSVEVENSNSVNTEQQSPEAQL